MASLPQYMTGMNQFDTAPLENGLARFFQRQQFAQEQANKQRQLEFEAQRVGMDQQRLGFEAARQPGLLRAQDLGNQQLQQGIDLNPLQRAQMQAATGMTRAHADLFRAQAQAATQKDAMDQLIMQNFGGGQPQQAPSPVRPQSFVPPGVGGPQSPMPQRVSDIGQPQPQPDDPAFIRTQAGPAQPPQQAPADPIVQTPMGPMPATKARQLGFLLAYKGKGDAGRMVSDPADPGKLKDAARGELDKGELHAVEQLSRMKAVKDGFDPKFLTLAGHAENLGVSWADYLGMSKDLDPATMKTHQEYVAFHRDVTDNLNRYIKEITGAAMGVDEAKRIIASMPSASDGPAAFQAKLKGVVKATELAVARYRFLRKEGFEGQPWQGTGHDAERAMPVDSFKKIIDRAGDQYEQQFRQANPQGDPKAIQAAVREALKYRFGMSI